MEPTTISSRTLPSSHSLSPTSVCPTSGLVVLENAQASSSAPTPPPPVSQQPKLTLIRQTGAMDHVWDWTPPPPPPPPPGLAGGLAKPVNRLQMMRDKGKGKTGAAGNIKATVWSSNGEFLGAGLSNPPGTTQTPTLHLIDLHSGKSALPPSSLPPPSSPISHLSWHLNSVRPPPNPTPRSSALALIARLPPLPTLSKEPVLAAPGGPGGPGGAAAGPGSALYGAKAAMLQKEREKEAGRPVTLEAAAPSFPTLLPAPSSGVIEGQEEELQRSLLLVGDERGRTHVFLGGSVRLGSIETGGNVLAANVVPSPGPSDSGRTTISIVSHDFETDELRMSAATVRLPPTTLLMVRQSSALRRHLAHACEALQQARVLWDEARRLGKAWMERLSELSKNHGVAQPPATQLLLLLATGRANPALSDYLSSKMNERSLAKWESSTAEVLARLKNCLWMDVCPAVERVVLLIDELKAWHKWPQHFAGYSLDRLAMDQAVEVAKQVVRAAAVLERMAAEEERCFAELSAWLRFELEKVSAADGSDVHPRACFEPRPVAHYLHNCLTDSAISPFLAFGLSTSPLDSSVELKEVRTWLAGLSEPKLVRVSLGAGDAGEKETLETMAKRMKEELKGQLDAQWAAGACAGAGVGVGGGMTEAMPARVTEPATGKGPAALPALLHVLVETVAGVMERAIGKIGQGVVVGEPTVIGLITEPDPTNLPRRIKSRIIKEGTEVVLLQAWVDGGTLHVVRLPSASEPWIGRAALSTAAGHTLDPIGWDFLDDTHLVLAVAEREPAHTDAGVNDEPAKPNGYTLGAVDLQGLDWVRLRPSQEQPVAGLVRWSWEKVLDARAPPEGLAVGSRGEVVLVGSEGRRVEVLGVAEGEVQAA